MPKKIRLKRVYEKPSLSDGQRVLVERLWPRGLTKSRANVDLWLKELAPSPELRKWFAHDLTKWRQFKQRYLGELRRNRDQASLLRQMVQDHDVTFIYAARDPEHNSAVVLKEFLELAEPAPGGSPAAGGRRPAARHGGRKGRHQLRVVSR